MWTAYIIKGFNDRTAYQGKPFICKKLPFNEYINIFLIEHDSIESAKTKLDHFFPGVDIDEYSSSEDSTIRKALTKNPEGRTWSWAGLIEKEMLDCSFGTKYQIAWIRAETKTEIKCECGGDAARTTHSSWCPKYN